MPHTKICLLPKRKKMGQEAIKIAFYDTLPSFVFHKKKDWCTLMGLPRIIPGISNSESHQGLKSVKCVRERSKPMFQISEKTKKSTRKGPKYIGDFLNSKDIHTETIPKV